MSESYGIAVCEYCFFLVYLRKEQYRLVGQSFVFHELCYKNARRNPDWWNGWVAWEKQSPEKKAEYAKQLLGETK